MFRLLKVASTLLLVMSLTACEGEAEEPEEGAAGLRLSANPTTITDDGQLATLRVIANGANGATGSGQVTLTTPAGAFGNEARSITAELTGGQANVSFRCVRAQDSGCQGNVTVTATWNEFTRDVDIQLTRTTPDSGTPDSGTPDSGTPDSGTPDAGPVIPEVGAPANIVYQPVGTKEQLGIKSSNLDTSTPVSFVVVDLKQQPVPGVTVNFEVRGVGGAAVTPTSAVTDGQGRVSTTLLAGNEVGIATVRATVTSVEPDLTAASLGTPIVGARPSDEGFVIECNQINLAANASATPPRKDLSTPCSAQLVDRFRNPVGLRTSVSWYSEAGSIESPVSTGGATRGRVNTTFQTAGKWPPFEVSNLMENEPFDPRTGQNPRDMLVTVIAVTSGEETFYDGSGVSQGTKDGEWNAGEWFVDLPEPFVDENDNQVYDLGEPFIDTERLDCATGQRQGKNARWDPPNGCWDGDIQIWRATHILYSGFINARFAFTAEGPYELLRGTSQVISVLASDGYFNPVSPDAAYAIAVVDTTKGGAQMLEATNFLNRRGYGMSIIQELRQMDPAVRTPPFRELGPCNTSVVPSGTSARDALCMWRTRFADFTAGNRFRVRLTGAPAADTTPTAVGSVIVTIGNNHSEASAARPITLQ